MKKALIFPILFLPFFGLAQLQSLMNIKSWAYQLQGISIPQVAADTTFDLVIIDYSADGTDDTKFSPAEIASIRSSGKKVIAYISIGEAEDYRYYWQSSWTTTPPSWLGPENPDWAGNYKVRFWDPQWQSVIFSYLDTIINQGFDGIYMDIIDAYYYWMVDNPEETFADTLMMDYVKNIRAHITTVTGNEDFIMIPQNAEDIISSTNVTADQKTAYFNSVNAAGVEDVFCYGNLDEDNPFNPDTYRIGQLQEWLSNDKQVFSIEYLTQSSLINQYTAAAQNENFVPYVCTRALDQLCPGIPVGLNEYPDVSFDLSPNPSSGIINIVNDDSENLLYSVYSPAGNCLVKGDDVVDDRIDISFLPEGIYIIRLESKQKSSFQKIILQK